MPAAVAQSCDICGEEFRSGAELRRHITDAHREPAEPVQPPLDGVTDFSAPRPRSPGAKAPKAKRARPKRDAPVVSVDKQVAMLYSLMGDFANARQLPNTGAVIKRNADDIGKAWDEFLQQFPGLYDMISRGMVFGPAVTLIMLHVPIFQTARMEAEARAQWIAQNTEGGEVAA
jgi:hypothetical protein